MKPKKIILKPIPRPKVRKRLPSKLVAQRVHISKKIYHKRKNESYDEDIDVDI